MNSTYFVFLYMAVVLLVGIGATAVLLLCSHPSKRAINKLFPMYADVNETDFMFLFLKRATTYHKLSECHQVFHYFFRVIGMSATIVTVYCAFDENIREFLLFPALIAASADIILLTVNFERISKAFNHAYNTLQEALLRACVTEKCNAPTCHDEIIDAYMKCRKLLHNKGR